MKELLDRIYDTLFENIGMSEVHINFLDESITDQEVGEAIYFKQNDKLYKLTLEEIT